MSTFTEVWRQNKTELFELYKKLDGFNKESNLCRCALTCTASYNKIVPTLNRNDDSFSTRDAVADPEFITEICETYGWLESISFIYDRFKGYTRKELEGFKTTEGFLMREVVLRLLDNSCSSPVDEEMEVVTQIKEILRELKDLIMVKDPQ